jgi:selenide, water dikinase
LPPGSLGKVLHKLQAKPNPDLLAGHAGFEDAGVMRLDDERALVQTLDFFPPIVDDPRWFGRIAAANSLSDVYAMGGKPLTAMNIVGWPRDLDVEILGEIMAGGLDKIEEAGAALCGGHSVVDSEIKYGLSVSGLVHPERFWRNAGAKEGDAMLVTKPLGMGAVSTALKKDKMEAGAAIPGMQESAMQVMATLNRTASEIAAEFDVHAATDITGFGFAGHSCEMLAGTGLQLCVEADQLPLITGALDLVRAGSLSGGCARGKQHFGGRVEIEGSVDAALADLVFDAETSGGLLIAVPSQQAQQLSDRLRDAGVPSSAIAGHFVKSSADAPLLKLR